MPRFFTAIDRYIFRLTLVPMLGVFVLAATLLMLEKMLRLMEFVSTQGGPITVVFRMLLNMLPEYASLAIPLGVLLGILFAFRKLAISSELDVMRAVGWSYVRMLRVPYLITIVMLALNFANVSYLQPWARFGYEQLDYQLKSGALGASIKVGDFNTIQNRMALRIEKSEDGGRKLLGIFARVADKNGQVLSISAREGRFLANKDNRNTIILRLLDGTQVHQVPGFSPRVLTFTQLDLPIDLPAIEKFRARGNDEQEFILPELLKIGWSPNVSQKLRQSTQAQFNFRMAEVLMMLMLPLLALALAIPPKRSTSSLGVFLSIIIVVAYHKVNQYGEGVASLGRINPYLALWGPFVVLACLILWLFYQVAFVTGGQPIGALENLYAKLIKWLKKLLRRGRRQNGQPEANEDETIIAA